MDEANKLVQLVEALQRAKTPEEQCDLAEEFIVIVRPYLYYFLARLGGVQAADDVLQETLVSIARGLIGVHGDRGAELWGWCYRIARRRLVDRVRMEARNPAAPGDEETWRRLIESTAPEDPISPEERLQLEHAMALLLQAEPACYNYLSLHYIEELDYGELGRIYGIEADAARMRVQRCVQKARVLARQID